MKQSIIYPTVEQVQHTFLSTVRNSGGGLTDAIHPELLQGILDFVSDDNYYPTFEDKLTYLVFSINRNHIYMDGNKRLSITVGALFLLLNGYMAVMGRYLAEMENISYHLAACRIDKNLLQDILHSILEGETDFDESLKFRILEAIGDGCCGFDE